jgi:FkbM family methyltransferase
MYILKLYFVKVLKRLKIIKYFNFYLSKKINGFKVKIPFINGMGISNYIIESDWLDSLIIQFTKNEDHAFIDVGTNIGQTTIRLKTLRPGMKYIGFEPNSACSSYTLQLIKANNFQNCSVYNCALTSSIQTLVLEKTMLDDLRASVVSPLRPGYFKNKENILAIDYDSIFNNQRISFIKIDVEGAELEVILGMKQSIANYQPLIVCEVLDCHHSSTFDYTQSRATELSRLLSSMNYSIIRFGTTREKHKITFFEKIDNIKIEQWTPKSLDLNDYLFYPTIKEQEVLAVLLKICN